jgi:vanillate O-demethylase ferredoxin subunit
MQKLDASALLAEPDAGTHLYVCGPAGFMNYILDSAQNAGWSQNQVHKEFFAADPIDQSANAPFEVELASTGQVFQIPAERTVFEVLDEAGIAIESSCEQGVCGTCVTRVFKGIPEHRDKFLTVAEQAANDRFTPCCSRARSSRLVLDL